LEWKGGTGLVPAGTWFYHFEFGCEWFPRHGAGAGPDGSRGIMPRSTPLALAVGRALVKFFGGALAYSDCDSTINVRKPWRSPSEVCPGDGEEWYTFQARKAAVKPLTMADLERERPNANYDYPPEGHTWGE